ncbi:PsbP [Xenococcus sp. PCC 7305]|uniref:photosystem II reaction center PsbP n=1 Tax=Xenococcus sp. PCC 7305 TaxID=102125 RepID=UPI0002ABE867|nr:photosystem II reaction center PsbP [Xenococcus sp. PCC 7305]ELS04521.1 PsbP [Xenococcus sp. PCC 7305]
MLRLLITLCLISLTTLISSCSAGISGVQSYVNPSAGYEFLYPNGWIPVTVSGASSNVSVVYRDLVERSENLSVIVSDVPAEETLEDLGTPTEVGYRFFKAVNDDRDRETEFISAESRQRDDQTYYIFEYEVTLPNDVIRHNVSSVAVSRGQLFTFNISTSEQRWSNVQETFEIAARSFTVR